MRTLVASLALLVTLAPLPACDSVQSIVEEKATELAPTELPQDARAALETRMERLVGGVIDEAFRDPEVAARMDAVFEKVFASPEVDAAMQQLVEGAMADSQLAMAGMMEAVMKDPAVIAKVQALVAGTSDPAEIEARVEKFMSAAVGSPVVEKTIDGAVSTLVETPAVEEKLAAIFRDSRFVPPVGDDPALLSQSVEFDRRFAKADAAGKRDAFLDAWEQAVKADPTTKKQAKVLLLGWLDAVERGPELRRVVKGGLESPRTRALFGGAMRDILADPTAAKAASDVFQALMSGAAPEVTAERAKAFLGNPKFVSRMQEAIVELLRSEKGAEALREGFLSALREPTAKKNLFDFVGAMLRVMPPE